jgi:AcrR family transcriptional regulator
MATMKQVRRRPETRRRMSKRERTESRQALLDAATRVFARSGYSNATVDDVAAEAGLSKGAVYWHFESKAALFAALLEERIDRPVEALMRITEEAPPERPTAPDVSKGLAALLGPGRDELLLAGEYWVAAARDPKLQRQYRRRQRKLRNELVRALRTRHEKQGMPLMVPPERLATAFIALGTALSLERAIDPDSVPDDLFGEMLSLMYDGNAARAGRD